MAQSQKVYCTTTTTTTTTTTPATTASSLLRGSMPPHNEGGEQQQQRRRRRSSSFDFGSSHENTSSSNDLQLELKSSNSEDGAHNPHHTMKDPETAARATATTTTPNNINKDKDSAEARRVSFASRAQISSVPSEDKTELIPIKNAGCNSVSAVAHAAMRSLTPDTFSDASSATSGDGPWEVIEYDPSDQLLMSDSAGGLPSALLFGNAANGASHPPSQTDATQTTATPTTNTTTTDDDDDHVDGGENNSSDGVGVTNIITAVEPPTIAENTPAAEALKASASVRVSRVGKAARAVHINAVRKLVKRATGTTRSGVVKGKPPRLPPQTTTTTAQQHPYTSALLHDDLSDLMEDDIEAIIEEEEEFEEAEEEEEHVDEHDDDHDHHDSSTEQINESQVIHKRSREQQQKQKQRQQQQQARHKQEGIAAHQELLDAENDEEREIEAAAAAAQKAERQRIYQQQQQQQQLHHDTDHQNPPVPDHVVQGTVEAGKKVLGAVDPHDMLKLLRWRKKRSGSDTSLQPKSYVKGKVIDGEHELYTLSIAVMIGVRTSISKTNIILNSGPGKRWVQPMDFRTTEKYEFRPKGGTGLPAHQLAHTFKFKDYSPVVFAYLRRMAGINEFDFLISVCANANFIEFISNARSGQFFFYSSDGRYMIKTMTNAESKFLRRILPDYFRHCCKNPNTMITRFFGMYRVKLYHLRRNVKFVIMNSVYYTDKYLQTFYDLKGSSVGRDAKPGQAVLKDNDLRRGLPEEALALSPETRKRVRKQVESDCAFLSKMQIMDYSMLVGVHHVPPSVPQTSATSLRTGGSIGHSGSHGGGDDTHNSDNASVIATTGFQGSRRRLTSDASVELMNNLNINTDTYAGSNTHADHDHLDAMRSSESAVPMYLAAPGALPQHQGDVSSLRSSYPQQQQIHDDFFYDDGLDDDESSYLQGSDNRQRVPGGGGGTGSGSFHGSVARDTELKKMATIEKLYWPFHRLFDIHGHRRLEPAQCPICGSTPCDCKADRSLLGFKIAEFCKPLSDRKDGGLEMDTSCLTLPMIYKGSQGDSLMYEGKIFYMGVIDVLQEYNSRKLLESHYRLMQTSGKYEASCVAPGFYAERFLSFFDEYTKRDTSGGGRRRHRRQLGNGENTNGNGGQDGDDDDGVEMTLAAHSSRSMIEL